MSNNATNKNLIEILTKTHQNPATAYKMAIQQAKTQEQAEQVRKIATALKIKI